MMRKIRGFKIEDVPAISIAFAVTGNEAYDGVRVVVADNFPESGEYTVIFGEHCSCGDFEIASWEAIAYTKDELLKLAESWEGRYGIEKIIGPSILRYYRKENFD